jgi:hypothetical protein
MTLEFYNKVEDQRPKVEICLTGRYFFDNNFLV